MTTKFTKDHEWITVEGQGADMVATVGITAYAAEQLGDVVFVETPEPGASFSQGDDMAVVESVKAASDVYAPISGEIIEANGALTEAPETVNADPEGAGWFCQIKISDASELDDLMDANAYAKHCEGEA
ncbi:MAG: glycine cleavage system protein GcvH [Pseudomonadota bacterium]